ncbi:MAG: DUF971 domain-containing protein [Pirellulaceae bacterium]
MTNVPTDIQANTAQGLLSISWSDHPTWSYPFRYLREKCECAKCVHEITGEPLLVVEDIPTDIHVTSMNLVGNYALKIVWSDGHDTGLYTWDRIRELCQCPQCGSDS